MKGLGENPIGFTPLRFTSKELWGHDNCLISGSLS
jgi:hypothetical protein